MNDFIPFKGVQLLFSLFLQEQLQFTHGSKGVSGDFPEANILEKYYFYNHRLQELFEYQAEGIEWLFCQYNKGSGGILADDMGLGKTVQVIVFIAALMHFDVVRHVLIITPKTISPQWMKELRLWAPEITFLSLCDGPSQIKQRINKIWQAQGQSCILLATYGLAMYYYDFITCNEEGKTFVWDYCILDEAHVIKNQNKTSAALFSLKSKFRLCITGTPLQNNLKELWMLLQFITHGKLFGPYKDFKKDFEIPIMKAMYKDASEKAIILGTNKVQALKLIYEPYFMRRQKSNIQTTYKIENRYFLQPKYDLVIWIQMNGQQTQQYKEVLIKANSKNTNIHPLSKLSMLKKICDHPLLLKDDERDGKFSSNYNEANLIASSGKLAFCFHLLEFLKRRGHKIILFSSTRKMLDIFQEILLEHNWKFCRLDGKIRSIRKRTQILENFQNDKTIPIILVTSQIANVGINLTVADRVILFDPSWNPSNDAQAIDRAHRIGQMKPVVVYRLLTSGTIEEKIYRRQLYKTSIFKQAVDFEMNPRRYFSKDELNDLFTIGNVKQPETCRHLNQKQQDYPELPAENIMMHINELNAFPNVIAVSNNNSLFSK